MRLHLEAEARVTGRPDPALSVRVPFGAEALWDCFAQLDAARPTGFSAGRIPPSEIEAWQRLHGVRLTPWELDTLLELDRARLNADDEARASTKRKNVQTPAPAKGRRR